MKETHLRHAFLIIAHKDPELLIDLVRLVSGGNSCVLVNIDRKSKQLGGVKARISSYVPEVIYTDYEVAHGGYSQISTTIKMLKAASELDVDYCHLISGQDFPCKSTEEFDRFFENHNGESFMWFDTKDQHEQWIKDKYPSRTNMLYFNDLPFRKYRWINKFVAYLNAVSSHMRFRRDIPGLRGGWNWFSWNRKVVDFVLEKYKCDRRYFDRFKYTHCCDEIIFHTLLYPHLKQLNIHSDNSLRYIDWSNKSGSGCSSFPNSPAILSEKDFERIINSDCFFCRKVDSVKSTTLINALSQVVCPGFKSVVGVGKIL